MNEYVHKFNNELIYAFNEFERTMKIEITFLYINQVKLKTD